MSRIVAYDSHSGDSVLLRSVSPLSSRPQHLVEQHLEQVADARRAGVPVDGYFAWSLMDNFEWSQGYTLRYGIVHVDFETQERRPKDSAHFLRSLSRRHELMTNE